MIEIEAELERDVNSSSGFMWTSLGPNVKFSAGTTTHIYVTAEERAPITWLIPILRTWTEGTGSDETP